MSAAVSPPPGLPPPEPGYHWVHKGGAGGWSLEKSLDGEREKALTRIEHRRAFEVNAEIERQAREHAATVAERAESALRVVPDDAELGCVCTGLTPTRAELVRTVAWVELSKRRLASAEERAAKFRSLEAKRDALRTELETLEAAVKDQSRAYHEYASQVDEPDSRDVDRSRLRSALDSAIWECSLMSADGLVVETAERVVRTLEDRLPALRDRVLIEVVAQPYLAQIRAIAEQLDGPLSVLCSIGEATATSRIKSSIDDSIAMPLGNAVQISVSADDEATAKFLTMLRSLEADPLASIGPPKFPDEAKRRTWLRKV